MNSPPNYSAIKPPLHLNSSQKDLRSNLCKIIRAEAAIALFRTRLISKGVRGLLGLVRLFHLSDDTRSGTLGFNDFSKHVKERRLNLDSADVHELFHAFDLSHSKRVHYNNLMKAVCGSMSDFRKLLVRRAFDRLSLGEGGEVEAKDVRTMYNPSGHPAVLEGRKSEDEALQEFLETFEVHHTVWGSKKVSEEEFEEYYNYVSATVDSDEYFEKLIRSAWNLKPLGGRVETPSRSLKVKSTEEDKNIYKEPSETASPSARIKARDMDGKQRTEEAKVKFGNTERTSLSKSQSIMLNRFRSKLISRGTKAVFGMEKQFKLTDIDESGRLTKEELRDAIRDYRVDLDSRDFENLMRMFGEETGVVNYKKFLQIVVGRMSELRKIVVEKAFDYLDVENEGAIDMKTLRDSYDGRMDPDVKLGRKTEDESTNEFIMNFDIHHDEYKAAGDIVTKEEFIEYYTKISAAIGSDSHFSALATNVWGIGAHSNTNRLPYAGVSSKIYAVDTKSIWSYDHHRAMLGDNESSAKSKSIYEMSEVGRSAALPSRSISKKSLEDTKGREYIQLTRRSSRMASLKNLVEKLQERGVRGFLNLRRKLNVTGVQTVGGC
eukprot:TRINITY_DN10578_c0_g2_i1.p1 TRINITY_DN10578_c0_g2~~TRINITY_DN10578_c0_g2_i1.p1  ORF type:complete len:604 (-),score=159.16 TRINITY_DN10578_c0_g2_i1:699-2510(-)